VLAWWAVPILAEPFELTACRLIFSDRPGCGIKWDERAVRRFRLAT
jgi:L-alanine-DL-glutamate epimerase-like enolase superfamily enzyme